MTRIEYNVGKNITISINQSDYDPKVEEWALAAAPYERRLVIPEDRVNSQVAEEVLVLAENLAAQRGPGNVHQVLPAIQFQIT